MLSPLFYPPSPLTMYLSIYLSCSPNYYKHRLHKALKSYLTRNKMKLSFPFKNVEAKKRQSWQWQSCKQPKTLSFRASDELIKTINSVYVDPSDEVVTPDTWFTTSLEELSLSTESDELLDGEELSEVIVQDLLLSERLIFEPEETRSILKQKETHLLPFEDSVAMAMESKDPCGDFRRSMEEIVETYGLREWDCLDELLGWYLKMNGKKNHGFIVGAFVDLIVGMVSTSTNASSDSDSFASCVSSPSTPLYSL